MNPSIDTQKFEIVAKFPHNPLERSGNGHMNVSFEF